MAVSAYVPTVATLLWILIPLALLFAVVRGTAEHFLGLRRGWRVWLLFTVATCAGCIWKLSGLARGDIDPSRIVYYVAVALAAIGLPLACAECAYRAVRSRSRNVPVAIAMAWLAALSAAPVAAGVVALIDRASVRLSTPVHDGEAVRAVFGPIS
jgi:hypothetical protein